jgi:eukaryotic-like serine/threonine-protein kinase
MKTEDWQQIEDVFHAALNVEAEHRSAYLATACGGDESLRLEVESLLKAFETEESFMEQPAMSLGMKILSEGAVEELTGKTVGSYKILRQLGRGGMGEVYLAEDAKLNRKVALKFFSSHHTDNVWMRRQLTKEARAVASLEHPNICAVYGIEQADGYDFIVMQYIEGQTLDALMAGGPLELERILELSHQIVSALAAAHSHGIIHRDIKPPNIMVTADGQIKVLDFGLAKVVQQQQNMERAGEDQSQLSQTGVRAGTVAYMSPEQLRTEELDFRSDIFSVGITLYELISGKNPYKHKSEAETISATLTGSPSPLAHPATRIPPTLNAIVRKCLEKEKEQRYQSASELLSALNTFRSTSRRRFYFSRRAAAVAALVLLLLLSIGLLYAYLHSTRVQTMAVLPLINESPDPNAQYLSTGLTVSLVNQLSRLSSLRVKAPSFPSGFQAESMGLRKLGRLLNVDTLLVRKIKQSGESLVLQVQLVNTADGLSLWQQEYTAPLTKMATIQNEFFEKIISILHLTVSGDERKLAAKGRTDNLKAFELYLQGRHYWSKRNKENIQKAIDYFKQATDEDPLYALAWAGLADAYTVLPTVAYGSMTTKDAMSKAKAAARQALEIDETLCEAHISMGVIKLKSDWNWPEAEREFKRAIELNPENASAHFWYAELLTVTNHLPEAIAESKAAREIDPLSPLVNMNMGRSLYRARDYDRAIEDLKRTLAEDANNVSALYVLGYAYQQKGMSKEAIEIFEGIYAKDKMMGAAPLGYAYAKAGRRAEALEILDEIEEQSKKEHVPAQERAIIYIGLDDKDQAFSWLEKSFEEHFAPLIYLTSDPVFDSLRSDPRFAELTRRVNLQ